MERMTKPTQAQIKAAAEAMYRLQLLAEDQDFRSMAKAALTAAAEVCPECKKWENRYAFAKSIYEKELAEMKAAITAAAGVGEQCGCGYDQPSDVCMLHEPIVKAWVADTIERCAQVAEGFVGWRGHRASVDIAAAIRAMKDDTNDE